MASATVTELRYVDEGANHDKFYRVFVLDDMVITQYGRSGTFGHFGRKDYPSSEDAHKAADKAVMSKIAKGYAQVDSETIEVPDDPTDADLDKAAAGLGSE